MVATPRAQRAWRRYRAHRDRATTDAQRLHAAAEYARAALTHHPGSAPRHVRRLVHELEQLGEHIYGGEP